MTDTNETLAAPPAMPGVTSKARMPGVVYLLAAVTFLIGTTELVVAGLLPEIAGALDVTQAQAGLLVTLFAVGMIIGAPVMAMATLRVSPRASLVGALLLFSAAHFVAALSSSFTVELVARFFAGVATGTFWAVGATVATAAAGAASSARATSLMVGGLTLANVLGVPIGTAVGQWLGWRAPFWALAVLAVITAVILALRLPRPDGAAPAGSFRAEVASLRKGRLWLIYLACALVPGAFLSAYSYVSPMLIERAHVVASIVPVVLLGYGVATIIGTAIGGRLGDERPFWTAIPAVVLIAIILGALALFGANPVVAIAMFVLLGLVALIAQPVMIGQAIRTAGNTYTLAIALSTSALNVGIAGGSALGGIGLASSLGTAGPAVVGAIIAVVAVIVLLILAKITTSGQSRETSER